MSWPTFLKDSWANWLENIGYPETGVGDLTDLKLTLGVGDNGRWVGFVNSGWYYYDNREQYKYVQASTVTVSGASGSGSVSAYSFRPSWGPVLVFGTTATSSNMPFVEHNNSFYPAASAVWSSGSSGLYYTAVPTGCLLYGVRNLTNLPLGSVSGTGLLDDSRLYYYDMTNNLVYIKPKSVPTDYYLDLVYSSPNLKMRELVILEDGVLKASYQRIYETRYTRGSETVYSSGLNTSGIVTYTGSSYNNGDWFVLEYYIRNSFVLKDHNLLHYYCDNLGTDNTLSIYYESSIPDIFPNITLSEGASGTFNINPTYSSSFRSGYLFHANPASAIEDYWTVGSVDLNIDKDIVCKDWNEMLKAKLIVYADNGLPLPHYPITISTNGSALMTLPSSSLTDNRGEVHMIIAPTAVGALTVSATAGVITASVSALAVASGSLITIDKWLDGHVNIIVSNEKNGRGGLRTYLNAINLDGIPRSSAADTITLHSKLSSEFLARETLYTKNVTLGSNISVANLAAISEVGYTPQPNERLIATSNSGQSNIVRSDI